MDRVRLVFDTIPAALAGARTVALSTLGFALAFVFSVAILFFGAVSLPDNGTGSVGFLALAGVAMFSGCAFSAAAYQRLLGVEGKVLRSAWQLMLAWFLVAVIAAIIVTFLLLFFSLIGSSLGVVSAERGQDITDMAAQMRDSGTFYPLFGLFILTLLGVFWFSARMMLFAAATVAQGSVHVFRTWAWTKGAFLRLAFGLIVFVLLPVLAALYVAHGVLGLLPATESLAMMAVQSAAVHAAAMVPVVWVSHGFTAFVLSEILPKTTPPD